MTYSTEWDIVYANGTHLSVWPWSDLVSFVHRYGNLKPRDKVLELGCGAGANIPLFGSFGVEYYGIDGSQEMIESLKTTYPDEFACADFTQEIPFEGPFDLVVDRASLTHNNTASIQNCLELVYAKLVPSGKYIGIDWFSTLSKEFQEGTFVDDPNTKTGYRTGRFANIGEVHFSDDNHLKWLFQKFRFEVLQRKDIIGFIGEHDFMSSWNFVVVK